MLDQNRINKLSAEPLHAQLKQLLIQEIQNKTYKPGDMMPTEKQIGEMTGLSRATVRQAMSELAQEGWITRTRGKGTFVTRQKLGQDFVQKLENYESQIRRLGMQPRTEVLEFRTVYAPTMVMKRFNVPARTKVIYLYRRRFADEVPIVLVETYLLYDKCSFLFSHNLEKESLYQNLKQTDKTRIHHVRRTIEAVEASTNDVKLLDIRRGRPIQKFETTGYNKYGDPVEFSIARYRGDYNKFEVTVLADE